MNTEQLEKWIAENCFCAGECSSGASVVAPNDLRALFAGKVLVPVEPTPEMVAVTGYHSGHCVVEPIDRAQLLPVGMALYNLAKAIELISAATRENKL
jgi:hypothetical protein